MAIYFIQVGVNGPIKIDRSDDPARYREEMQVYHYEKCALIASIKGDAELRRKIWEDLKGARCNGLDNWFYPTPEVLDYIWELES